MKKGDKVGFRVRGREQWEVAEVLMVSANQKSIALALEHLVPGLPLHGIHPEHGVVIMLLYDDGSLLYRDMASGTPCDLMVRVQ